MNARMGDTNSKAVVFCSGGIGDALMTMPLLRVVGQRHDGCHIVVDNLGARHTLAVAGIGPEKVTYIPFGSKSVMNRQLAMALLRGRYAHSYQNHVSHGGFKYLYLPWLLRIPNRHGWPQNKKLHDIMVNRCHAVDGTGDWLHQAQRNLSQVCRGLCRQGTASYRLDSFCQIARVKGRFGIHPGSDSLFSISFTKRWPVERFVALAKTLTKEGIARQIRVFIGPKETDLGRWFQGNGFDVVEKQSIRDLFGQIATCEHFVSNDSGLAHIAYSVGLKPFVLHGPTDWRKTGPIECVPIIARNKDIRDIAVEDVLQTIRLAVGPVPAARAKGRR